MKGFAGKANFSGFSGNNSDIGDKPLIPLPRVKLSAMMKLAIAEQQEDDRSDFKEVAECLEEIVTAACKG